MASYLRERRRRLFERDPHCYYCGVETIWWENPRGKPPMNAATLEHLNGHDTSNGKRVNYHGRVETTVLACWECNHKRSFEQTRTFPKFATWWRSGAFPTPFRWFGRILRYYRRASGYKGRKYKERNVKRTDIERR